MTSGDTPDASLMNKHITELVNRATSSTYSGKDFNFDKQPTDDIQMLFSDKFIDNLKKRPYQNTTYQALVKLLKPENKEFGKTNSLKAVEFSKKIKDFIDHYNSRNTISDVDDISDDVINNLRAELEKIFTDLKQEKQSFENLGIIFEKNFLQHSFPNDTRIFLTKKIQKLVSNKSKYTDWTNWQDVKDELYADEVKLLRNSGYPPKVIVDAYDKIMKQVENYKQYAE